MSGDQGVVSLISEINKIVSAPYAVLLKPLLHILETATDNQLYLWTLVKRCQIPALVSCLVEALDSDKAAWPVVLRCVKAIAIRDEFIRQHPEILRKLFADTGDDRVFDTCVALCEHAFPESFALPPEYFSFIAGLLINGRNDDTASWISNLYSVLSKTTLASLHAIDEEAISKGMDLWGDLSKATDNTTLIRFMSIAAIMGIKHSAHRIKLSDVNSLPLRRQRDPLAAWMERCASLFIGPKAQKVIRGLLLRMLYFISEETNALNVQNLEMAKLTRLVLTAMPTEALHLALQEHEMIQVLRKMAHKLQEGNISVTMRLCFFTVLLIMDPTCSLWDMTMLHATFLEFSYANLARKSISKATEIEEDVVYLKFWPGLDVVLQDLFRCCFLETSIVKATLRYLIEMCQPDFSYTVDTVQRLDMANTYATALRTFIVSDKVCKDVRSCVIQTAIPEWWGWNNYSSQILPVCAESKTCPPGIMNAKIELSNKISDLFLRVACTSETTMSQALYQVLHRNSFRSKQPPNQQLCTQTKSRNRPQDRLSYNSGTQSSDQPKCRQDLNDILSTFNGQTLEAIFTYIDNTCRDLQQRCEAIEAPLRTEREKCAALQQSLNKAQQDKDVILADHLARRLSWQNSMELAQEEATSFQKYRNEVETKLCSLKQQLEKEHLSTVSMANEMSNVQRHCDLLSETLEQEKARVRELGIELDIMATEKERIHKQLQDCQEKEHELLRVLKGNSIVCRS